MMKLQERLERLISSVDFDRIIIVYFMLILAFAALFFFLTYISAGNGIAYSNRQISLDLGGFLDALYFSFVTSTSLGYGDIHPIGISRLFSIVEVVVSLIIFGILVSKLLSVKQERILEEIYEISFQGRVTRVLSGLYDFRAEIDRITSKLGKEGLSTEETDELMQDIETNMHLLSSYLVDMDRILLKEGGEHVKKLSDFRADIILDNLHSSIAKIEDLIAVLKARDVSWKSAPLMRNMNSIFSTTENICVDCINGKYENIQAVIDELRRHSRTLKKEI